MDNRINKFRHLESLCFWSTGFDRQSQELENDYNADDNKWEVCVMKEKQKENRISLRRRDNLNQESEAGCLKEK